MNYVMGIDPGAHGALALFCPEMGQVLEVKDMPNNTLTLTTGKKSARVDAESLVKIIANWFDKSLEDDAKLHAHIEAVQAYGKQSAPAAFNFGYAAGLPFGICTAFGLDTQLIAPAKWKNQFGLKASEKDEARLLVRQLFPHLNHILSRKMDVDRADAILLSMYKPRIN